MVPCQLSQHVRIPRHELILGDDHNGVTEVGKHSQAAPRQLQTTFDRLVRISDPADGEHLWFPAR